MKDVEMRGSSWILRWTLHPWSVLIRGEEARTQKTRHVWTKAEMAATWLQATERQGALEAGKGEEGRTLWRLWRKRSLLLLDLHLQNGGG